MFLLFFVFVLRATRTQKHCKTLEHLQSLCPHDIETFLINLSVHTVLVLLAEVVKYAFEIFCLLPQYNEGNWNFVCGACSNKK